MDVATRFGRNLFLCRRRAGLSQEKLAVRASLHRTEIGKLENAERLPRIDTLVKLAGAMPVPAERLLDGIVWKSGHSEAGRFELGPLKSTPKDG